MLRSEPPVMIMFADAPFSAWAGVPLELDALSLDEDEALLEPEAPVAGEPDCCGTWVVALTTEVAMLPEPWAVP